ncbi:hypothetical protein ACVWV0_002559 [Ewingella americana]
MDALRIDSVQVVAGLGWCCFTQPTIPTWV